MTGEVSKNGEGVQTTASAVIVTSSPPVVTAQAPVVSVAQAVIAPPPVVGQLTSIPAHWVRRGDSFYEPVYADGATDQILGYKHVASIQNPNPVAPTTAITAPIMSVSSAQTVAVKHPASADLSLNEPAAKRTRVHLPTADFANAQVPTAPNTDTRWQFYDKDYAHNPGNKI